MSVLRRKISGQRNGFFRYKLARSHSVSPFLTTCFTSCVVSEVTTRLFVVSARAVVSVGFCAEAELATPAESVSAAISIDRKSTRLNSSHLVISYAVFCLKKKKKQAKRNS